MSQPVWHPESLAARLPFLRRRALLTAATRAFFIARGYTEVETPYAVRAPGEEVHLRTFRTERECPHGTGEPLWLHTSPEFAMKKLLVAGAGPIFQLARVWRNGEGSDLHAPEFTMLEWYRPGADMAALIDETFACLRAVLPPVVTCRGVTTDLSRIERLPVAEAFARHAGADVLATADDAAALAAAAGARLREARPGRTCSSASCLSASSRDRSRPSHVPDALAGGPGSSGASRSDRCAGRRTVRAVRLRHRAGQRLRRTDRRRRNSAPASRRIVHGVTPSPAPTGRSTRTSWPRWLTACRNLPASRSASIGWR